VSDRESLNITLFAAEDRGAGSRGGVADRLPQDVLTTLYSVG